VPKIVFFEKSGVRREVIADLGQTLLEVARSHNIDIEGACEGNMACATCHLIVEEDWFPLLSKPVADEEDMLDLVYGLTATSRLGCQIKIRTEFDGLTVYLPVKGGV
jgi:2Fe-2S ferredoxin